MRGHGRRNASCRRHPTEQPVNVTLDSHRDSQGSENGAKSKGEQRRRGENVVAWRTEELGNGGFTDARGLCSLSSPNAHASGLAVARPNGTLCQSVYKAPSCRNPSASTATSQLVSETPSTDSYPRAQGRLPALNFFVLNRPRSTQILH